MKIDLIPFFIRKSVKRVLQPLILPCVRLHLNPKGLTTISLFERTISAYYFAIDSMRELRNTLRYLRNEELIIGSDMEYCN